MFGNAGHRIHFVDFGTILAHQNGTSLQLEILKVWKHLVALVLDFRFNHCLKVLLSETIRIWLRLVLFFISIALLVIEFHVHNLIDRLLDKIIVELNNNYFFLFFNTFYSLCNFLGISDNLLDWLLLLCILLHHELGRGIGDRLNLEFELPTKRLSSNIICLHQVIIISNINNITIVILIGDSILHMLAALLLRIEHLSNSSHQVIDILWKAPCSFGNWPIGELESQFVPPRILCAYRYIVIHKLIIFIVLFLVNLEHLWFFVFG